MPSPDATNDRQTQDWLTRALRLPSGHAPFPWQRRLLEQFAKGTIPRALDLPTGLGKTSVMAIWLVARALGASVPRRLVYVVDRRAVVDQATEVAAALRSWVSDTPEVAESLGLVDRTLAISTLRGQFIDNREWLEDPSAPAIIVGTVDMVGSRLLFEGYGVSRKMRPYHAALLSHDTLFVIDEAHLVPPFERLMESIASSYSRFGPSRPVEAGIPSLVKVLSLSATGRDHGHRTFRLDEEDLENEVVVQRIRATKRLVVHDDVAAKKLPEAVAQRAWELAETSPEPIRCIVFCSKRTDAEKAQATLQSLAKRARVAKNGVPTELFVGARRVRERSHAAAKLRELGFLAGSPDERPDHAFLFATSAGEVGVDLDADHMVADLVAWERMVQRLGRVNRRGLGDAWVHIIPSDEAGPDFDRETVLRLLTALPSTDGGERDASPQGLATIQDNPALTEDVLAGRTKDVLWPELSRPLLEAWAMTSLREHTGRPEVAPWLRGWSESQPQTAVVWRRRLADIAEVREPRALYDLIEAAPPHTSERLETYTSVVVDWLSARFERVHKLDSTRKNSTLAVILNRANEIERKLSGQDLALKGDARRKRQLTRLLEGATVVVDSVLAGLRPEGLLDERFEDPPATADGEDQDDPWLEASSTDEPPAIRFRFREVDGDPPAIEDKVWRERLRVALKHSEEGDVVRWLVIDKWRQDSATEEDRSTATRPQTLVAHHRMAEARARELAQRIGLSQPYEEMLATAARLHDEGKRAPQWQQAFRAPPDDVYAKTKGPIAVRVLGGYRHEFGSLPYAEADSALADLPPDFRDLALHLIAAHHGFARPSIPTDGCADAPPSGLEARARAVAMRYAELQQRWGPWGLAYWETLLRAADQQASRDNDNGGRQS